MDNSRGLSFTQSSFQSSQGDQENGDSFLLFKTYILKNHMSDIVRILLEEEVNVHYCLKIDGSDLLENYVALTEMLFFNSEKILKSFDHAFHAATCYVFGNHNLKTHMTLKPYLHIRFCKLPACSEIWRDRVPKAIDIGRFLVLEGTVIRTSSAKILEYKKEYMCTKCKNVFSLQSDFQLHYVVPTPTSCPVNLDCTGKKFVVMTGNDGTTGPKKCKDYQEVRVQEQVRKLSMGTIPRSITVVLEDDLVDRCKPGDDIVIFGSVMCRWHPSISGKPCDLELVLKANNIEVCNEPHSSAKGIDFEELQDEFQCFWATHNEGSMMKARNHILASLCPQVYGLYVVKLAVALVLAGGVQRNDPSGSRVRGECHLLLVGDPGTGKSQFLKYAAKVTTRSVLTTGIGSSTAGLTVSAIRDGPHWTLEAGALVLADGGICCIDEFSGIKEHDRSAIHEAMEQQTISVAKAGLVCKLNTRTSILAATNPKLGKYDEASSVSFNIAMASPLLSRFDLVLVLIDEKNLHWDSVVADYLLLGEKAGKATSNDNVGLWSLDQMQAYFGVIRQINPSLSSEADQVLRAYYRSHRQSDSRNAARTTIRLLESLIRLSEAHARLMFRNVVTIQDAIAAVTVVESSMQGASLLPTGSILHSCFPKDADSEYRKHARLVLQCLNLEHLLPESNSPKTQLEPHLSSQNVRESQIASQLPTEKMSQVLPSSQKKKSLFPKNVLQSQMLSQNAKLNDSYNDISQINKSSVNFDRPTPFKATDQSPVFAVPSNHLTPNCSTVKYPDKRQHCGNGETQLKFSQASQNSKDSNKKTVSNKENRFSVFQLDASETESMFNFEFASQEPAAKKPKSNGEFSIDFDSFAFPGAGKCSDARRNNLTSTLNANCDANATGSSPASSQVSLFSLNPIVTPKTQPKFNALSKHFQTSSATVSDKPPKNVSKPKNNLFSCSKLFQLPENEANLEFFETFDDNFSSELCNNVPNKKPLRDAASIPKIAPKQSFSFTLDPSVIEDMCGDFDL